MRVIVAGSRHCDDYAFVSNWLTVLLGHHGSLTIISGGANGVDEMGERWAKTKGLDLEIYRAEWDKHGKAAGPIRNRAMAENADMLIAFPASDSRGTKNMIATAKKHRILTVTIERGQPHD